MTVTSNIHTRQAVYINLTLWHICTTIVAVETHKSVLCFTTLSNTWHDLGGGDGNIYIYTVIPRLTKIIHSGITFVSRNLR
jgi:hypothetical protein